MRECEREIESFEDNFEEWRCIYTTCIQATDDDREDGGWAGMDTWKIVSNKALTSCLCLLQLQKMGVNL